MKAARSMIQLLVAIVTLCMHPRDNYVAFRSFRGSANIAHKPHLRPYLSLLPQT